jgi:hypothetical protein
MDEPWKILRATAQWIDLERGSERMQVQRPSNPAARAMFMQIRPGEMIDEALIHYFQTARQSS